MSSSLLHPGRNLPRRCVLSSQQNRFKHQNAHRTIPVKLLQDIPGVGEKFSIQPVAPGRMRHVFYPSKQAAYITERPRKDTSTSSSQPKKSDLSDLRSRLLSLEPLVFQRAVYTSDTAAITESRKLKSPVTTHDIIQRLAQRNGVNLVHLNGTVVFRNSPTTDRIDTTGEYHVLIHLLAGDIFPLKVFIESRADALKSRLPSREAVGAQSIL